MLPHCHGELGEEVRVLACRELKWLRLWLSIFNLDWFVRLHHVDVAVVRDFLDLVDGVVLDGFVVLRLQHEDLLVARLLDLVDVTVHVHVIIC